MVGTKPIPPRSCHRWRASAISPIVVSTRTPSLASRRAGGYAPARIHAGLYHLRPAFQADVCWMGRDGARGIMDEASGVYRYGNVRGAMDLDTQQPTASEGEVSGLGPRLSPRARMRRLIISVAAVLLALLVVAASVPALRQNALAPLSAPTPTPTPPPRSTVPEPTFLMTQIAVLAPAPAHAGDAVTVVVRLQAAYDAHDPQRSYSATTTSALYGPFASLAAVQDAVASSTNGPPSGTGLPLEVGLSTTITAYDSGVLTD